MVSNLFFALILMNGMNIIYIADCQEKPGSGIYLVLKSSGMADYY